MSDLSKLYLVLLNAATPVVLHAVNDYTSETIIVYGDLASIEMKQYKKGRKKGRMSYPLGHFSVDEKGYTGVVSASLSGYKNTSFLRMRLTIQKGFLGWEWLQYQTIFAAKS